MANRVVPSIVLWLLLANANGVVRFTAAPDSDVWSIDTSVFACVIRHEVPDFGVARFYHRAGNPLRFSVRSRRDWQAPVAVHLDEPMWRGGDPLRHLTTLAANEKHMVLASTGADELLRGLYRGESVRLAWNAAGGRPPGMSGDQATGTQAVVISPAGFRPVYRQYLECVSDLLPVNFEQVAKTRVLYATKDARLGDAQRQALDRLVTYCKADRSIQAIYIDGHTDAVGLEKHNVKLAERRARGVAAYLQRRGISEEKMVIRYHGERYPLRNNDTSANRAQNRRTTVRLDRNPPQRPVLPEKNEGKGDDGNEQQADATASQVAAVR